MLGFLISSEMVGRLLGGLLQYKKEIPAEKRYAITKFVYLFYSLADTVLLFLPYRAVAVLLGLAGIGSIFFLIVLPEKENRPVYEAQRVPNVEP